MPERSPIDPWPWNLELGFNRAELFEGAKRRLHRTGQTAIDANGHPSARR